MLDDAKLEQILSRLSFLTIGVLGDLFLDRYLEIDPALTEPSLETGLDAYQVVRVRSQPGAAGTVVNNLVALGVGQVRVLSVVGDDGEGHELRRALAALGTVNIDDLVIEKQSGFRTPTYTKPLLCRQNQAPQELNRLDIKNRIPLAAGAEQQVLQALEHLLSRSDAVLVVDQVSLPNTGVITERVRVELDNLARRQPKKFILVDSRERIGLFRSVAIKPNEMEALKAESRTEAAGIENTIRVLAQRLGRPVFCTRGKNGILLADPTGQLAALPAYAVAGPIDVVGAGDSTAAAMACAAATGVDPPSAAAFGNLVASITIQQIGTTGTATPDQVRERWRQIHQ
jgi:rfaE bifunctional protein kinase chain/domain